MLKRIYTFSKDLRIVQNPRQPGSRVAASGNLGGYKMNPDMLYVQVRAISARVNQNYDGFPSKELKKAAHTFIGRPVFINHNNDDYRETKGIILDSQYKESGKDKYIELFLEIDAKAFPRLASLISTGELDSVSMGCMVAESACSVCGNVAQEISDFCDHVRYHKGQKITHTASDGSTKKVLVYETCKGLNFFEISYVFDPADPSAINQRVYVPSWLNSRKSSLPSNTKESSLRKRAVGELSSPAPVDTLRNQQACPQCGDENFDGKHCDLCDYAVPPEKFQDPDTMKSRVLQIVRRNSNRKEGRDMGNGLSLEQRLAQKRLADARRRLAEVDLTTDEARQSDSTDVSNLNNNPFSQEEVITPDESTDVTQLPDYSQTQKNAAIARNRAAYINRKLADFGDPDSTGAQDSQPSDSDGPNSGPPTSDIPGTKIDDLPIDWKQDESGEPYGTLQGTDLDIFVNEDLTWQVLPEGSDQPIAEGSGTDYTEALMLAYQKATEIAGQSGQAPDPSDSGTANVDGQTNPSAAPAPSDPTDPTQKSSRRKRADDATKTKVEDLPDYDALEDGGGTYSGGEYDNNQGDDVAKPVDGSDVQNFAPGGQPFTTDNKTAFRKASAAAIYELTEGYVEAGLVANTRTAKAKAFAEFEKLTASTVADRLNLLNQLSAVAGKAQSNSAPRNTLPQKAASANNNLRLSSVPAIRPHTEEPVDYLLTL